MADVGALGPDIVAQVQLLNWTSQVFGIMGIGAGRLDSHNHKGHTTGMAEDLSVDVLHCFGPLCQRFMLDSYLCAMSPSGCFMGF
jgi:hypothetical protein